MYKVQKIDYDLNGTETRKTVFRSASIDDCWALINRRLWHPSALVREEASRLFVFDQLEVLQYHIPHRTRVLLETASRY